MPSGGDQANDNGNSSSVSDTDEVVQGLLHESKITVEVAPTFTSKLPPNLQAKIKAAEFPKIGRGRAQVKPTSRSLRSQLIFAFTPVVFITFAVVITAAGLGLYGATNTAYSRSQAALQHQVVLSSAAFVRDAGKALESQLFEGISGYLMPMVHSYTDASSPRLWPYSLAPPASFADTNQSVAGVNVLTPHEEDPRFPSNISTRASSVYFTNQQDSLASLWENNSRVINDTAFMDRWLRTFFLSHPEWHSAYVGMKSNKLFRHYPGIISNREEINYDATVRPWFSGANAHALKIPRNSSPMQNFDRVFITPPYLDKSAAVMLLTLARAIYRPDMDCLRAGLTSCASSVTDNNWVGVAGVDMLVSVFRKFVEPLKFSEQGQAHLFESATGTIVASEQWVDHSKTMPMTSVVTAGRHTFTNEILGRMTKDSDSFITDDVAFVYSRFLHSRFTLVMATSLSATVSPITQQLAEQKRSANELFGVAIGLGLASMILVALIVLLVAWIIVRPLQAMAKDSAMVSADIGRDVEMRAPDMSQVYVGEVNQLRVRFNWMLQDLHNTRSNESQRSLRPNPFYDSVALPVAPLQDPLQQNAKELLASPAGQRPVTPRPVFVEPPPVTFCNRLKTVVRVCVMGPTCAGLILVVVIVAVELHLKAVEWAQPVRDAMLVQETGALPVRVSMLGTAVENVFRKAHHSLQVYHDSVQDVWNVAHNLSSPLTGELLRPYPIFYVPHSAAAAHAANFPGFLGEVPLGGLDSDPRFPGVDELVSNSQTAHFYMNGNSGYKNQSGFGVPNLSQDAPIVKLQSMLSHTDNAARIVYFSNEQILAIYFADEQYESFRHYPYRSGEFYPFWQGVCTATGLSRIGYTPVCRGWYTMAKENQGKVNWTPLYLDATTGFVMISVSRAVHDANGKFIGVTCMDVSVDALNSQLKRATFYENGYVYVVDTQGIALLHPLVDLSDTQLSPLVDLELGKCSSAAERVEFLNDFQPRLLNATGPDQASYSRCGKRWLAAWEPVEDTPYVLVITLPVHDIMAEADDLAVSLNNTLVAMISAWVVIAVLAFIAGIVCSNRLARRFASSLEGLTQYLKVLRDTNYSQEPPSPLPMSSYELEMIAEAIHDLLIALRVSNRGFAAGNLDKELRNLQAALEIANRNQYPAAIGAIHDNIGEVSRRGHLHQARKHLELGVTYALAQVKKDNNDLHVLDTLGQRIFHLALLELEENNMSQAQELLQNVEAIHRVTRNGRVLINHAYTLLTSFTTKSLENVEGDVASVKGGEVDDTACIWIAAFARTGLSLLTRDSDTNSNVAMASLCLGAATKQYSWCVWALHSIPELSVVSLCQLARYACKESTSMCEIIDPVMELQPNVIWNNYDPSMSESPRMNPDGDHLEEKEEENSRSRSRVFEVRLSQKPTLNFVLCLDVSDSMIGPRLEQCYGAFTRILTECCHRSDHISLITFSTKANLGLPLQKSSHTMWPQLSSLVTGGKRAFFDGILLGVTQVTECSAHVMEHSPHPSWVIAVVGGDDTSSMPSTFHDASALLRQRRHCTINLVVVTVGKITDAVNHQVLDLCQAARDGGGQASTFAARHAEEIPAVFQQVMLLIRHEPH